MSNRVSSVVPVFVVALLSCNEAKRSASLDDASAPLGSTLDPRPSDTRDATSGEVPSAGTAPLMSDTAGAVLPEAGPPDAAMGPPADASLGGSPGSAAARGDSGPDAAPSGASPDAARDAALPDLGEANPDAAPPSVDSSSVDSSSVDSSSVDSSTTAPSSDAAVVTVPLPQAMLDVAEMDDDPSFFRLYGAAIGDGSLGVPVAGGDLDGDGNADLAMASFQASPLGRSGAGQIAVVFGAGAWSGALDLGLANENVLVVYGEGLREGAGNQLGIADVNDDGILDLLICRQNYRAAGPDRTGAGALSIVLGGSALRTALEQGGILDLATPPDGVTVLTLVGANSLDRLGIWVRTGDLTGDGVEDVVVGADQEDREFEPDAGAVYVIRGGSHLGQAITVDLASSSALDGHLAKVTPPGSASGYHFGATVYVADLDRNGRSELLAAAALVRSGASYRADGAASGSAVSSAAAPPGGRAYVVWDDNFPDAVWPSGYAVDLAAAPGPVTELLSTANETISNHRLGEELLAGGDYDGDGNRDLFVGDMTATAIGRSQVGVGFVVFDAGRLRGLGQVTLLTPPADLEVTTIVGPISGAIASDTVRHGDFDVDGVTDLAMASPNASPDGRIQAGTVHVLWGNTRRWPSFIDLANPPSADQVQITEVKGARGADGSDSGDMLAYSAEVADVDGDGVDDLIANEMGGNGLETGSIDSGNLLVLSGPLLARGRPDCSGLLSGSARIDACGACSLPGEETSCVRFTADVLPILLSACPSCHGSSGGLSLFSYDQLMAGSSDNGPVVIPGLPEESILWQKLAGTPAFGDVMPPLPDPGLSGPAVATIGAWIAAGARDN